MNKGKNIRRNTLFREEALKGNKAIFLGKVIIASPVSFFIWSITFFLISIALILFIYFAAYTKKHEVIGRIIPKDGLINIYPKKMGVVINRFKKNNTSVKKGDILYSISTEQNNLSGDGIITSQINSINKQILVQKKRIAFFQKRLKKYKPLLKQKMITHNEYNKFVDEYLSNKIALQDLEKNLNQMIGEKHYAIYAQSDGKISSIIAQIGDRVVPEKHLMTIIPNNAKLQGELFIPQSVVGFVKKGQKVLLKYQAYPYQTFGLYEAAISTIDQSTITYEDVNLVISYKNAFYKAKIDLKNQYVSAYGKEYPIMPGMIVNVIILGEKRTLLEWILHPFHTLKSSFAS